MFLVRIESLGERPPCVGELFEVGASTPVLRKLNGLDLGGLSGTGRGRQV
jgi:hypothetical protein